MKQTWGVHLELAETVRRCGRPLPFFRCYDRADFFSVSAFDQIPWRCALSEAIQTNAVHHLLRVEIPCITILAILPILGSPSIGGVLPSIGYNWVVLVYSDITQYYSDTSVPSPR